MMNIKLPEDFTSRMRLQLNDELTAFLHALEEKPVRGIRMNPLKPTDGTKTLTDGEQVPWHAGRLCERGISRRTLSLRGRAVQNEKLRKRRMVCGEYKSEIFVSIGE